MPKKTKYRKSFRGRRKGNSKGGNVVAFGDFGIQAVETSYVTGRQIEAARITITRTMKRGGKVWINIFPHKPITKKPAEVRMGSGKGNVIMWQWLSRVVYYSKYLVCRRMLLVKQ